MTANNLSLIIDCGGHGCRAMLIDAQADTVAEAFRPVDTHIDGARAEQDPETLLKALIEAVEEAVAHADDGIDAAALAVQRGNVLCWSAKSGRPLSPVISWRDRRTADFSPRLMDAGAIQARTGLRLSPYAGAAKLAWCLQNLPEVDRAQAAGDLRCGPVGAWLVERLTGQAGVDDTLAQRTLLWSRTSQGWDPDLCRCFGLPIDALPPVHPSRHDWGLFEAGGHKVSLALVCGDQNVLAWQDGQPDPATLAINLGTGGFMLRPLPAPRTVAEFQLSILDRLDGARYAMEASIHGVGSGLDWLLARHGQDAADLDLDQLAGGIESPPLFVNSIDGLGSPWWQAGPDRCFVAQADLSEDGLAAEVRALLESIAFLVQVNAAVMNRHSKPARVIRLSGGLSQNKLMCGLIANILDQPVQRVRGSEGTALGLWACLHGRAVPAHHFEQIDEQGFPGLEQRYQRWLALMPAY